MSKMKIVYSVNERSGRTFWSRIGVAFVNADGSLSVKLESLPVSGEMQIRDFVPRSEQHPQERFDHIDDRDNWGEVGDY